ncbi:MAG TPA: AraC family transcriptional regulator [Vicinamibacterales bacterium]|nr:AraC family transcriptional regulator [Vicinamibacterales bacterium]
MERVRAPRAELAPFVEALWLYDVPARPFALERVLPTAAPQLVINLLEDRQRVYDDRGAIVRCHTTSGSAIVGVSTRSAIIDTAEQQSVVGVSFRAGGTTAFFAAPAHELADAHVSLDDLWSGASAARLRARVLAAATADAKLDAVESALVDALAQRADRGGPHPAVRAALKAFRRDAPVSAVVDAIGLSPKRFIERFKAEVGVAPKTYCRILRFQRAVSAAHAGREVDWASLAIACGYFDQAHFIHDFHAFSGMTPTAYRDARTDFQNHVKFLQSAAAPI